MKTTLFLAIVEHAIVDKKITIFEWNHKHVSRNWLYTAITRATHLDNVKFFSKYCRNEEEDDDYDFGDEDCDSDDDDA